MGGGERDVVERVFWPKERPECHNDIDDEDDTNRSIDVAIVWLKWPKGIENGWKPKE